MLMLIAFAAIAVSARGEWHEERFSPLYLDETLAETREASILFADLQGFTSFSEQTPPARVAAMLNGYFGRLVPLLEQQGGVVHQIVGDSVMVIFNQRGDQPDHAARAARTALEFQAAATEVAAPTPTGRISAPRSTAVRSSPASSAARAAIASTAWSATPSTWPLGWSRRRRWARWSWAPRPPPPCLPARCSSGSRRCRSRARATRSRRTSCMP